jgi:hypothetical protein
MKNLLVRRIGFVTVLLVSGIAFGQDQDRPVTKEEVSMLLDHIDTQLVPKLNILADEQKVSAALAANLHSVANLLTRLTTRIRKDGYNTKELILL